MDGLDVDGPIDTSLRTLQHYEQGSKDLRHAAGETLLARTLGTTVEGLIL